MSKSRLSFPVRENGWPGAPVANSGRRWLQRLWFLLLFPVIATAAPSVTLLSPARNVVAPGQSLTLGVSATGSGLITFQWFRNNRAITDAAGSSLTINNAGAADSGWYFVDATDPTGTTRSAALFLLVAPAQSQIISWGSDDLGIAPDLSDAIALYPDGANLYVLRRNGTVTGYGANNAGQTDLPAGLNDVVQVSSQLALRQDGTVAGWGDAAAQAGIPAGLSGVVFLASSGTAGSGSAANLALKSDGTVVAWGSNMFGQCDVPASLTDVVAVTLGDFQGLALRRDGTVVAWGGRRGAEFTRRRDCRE